MIGEFGTTWVAREEMIAAFTILEVLISSTAPRGKHPTQ